MNENKLDISSIVVDSQIMNSFNFPPQLEDNKILLTAALSLQCLQNNETILSLYRQAAFYLTDVQNPSFNPIPYFFNDHYTIRKEHFLFTGIKNLRKNVKFLQLAKDLASKIITDEEFEAEIENNPEKYLIDINPLEDPLDAVLLHDIVNKVGNDLTIDEAGDIFSFESESIKEHLNKLSK